MLKQATKEVRIKLPHDFEPAVSFGSSVNISTLLGKGSKEIILEEYPLHPGAKVFVEDGQYVKPDTKLFAIKGLFDEIIGVSEHEGIVRITENSLKIIDITDNFEYKSPVKGRVSLLTPDEIVISAQMYKITPFAMTPKSAEGYLVYYSKDTKNIDITNKLVVVEYAPTLQLVEKLYRLGAKALIVPSIDWGTYLVLQQHLHRLRLVLLQGFSDIPMWNFFKQLFKATNRHYAQIDHLDSALYVTYRTIEFDRNYAYIFKDQKWGVEVPSLKGKPHNNTTEYETFYL